VPHPRTAVLVVAALALPALAWQTKLSANDGLMEYLRHTGSAIFAVPPGVRKGGYVGEGLLFT
jgi:deferrochelatase/peroxidase EfeB